MGYCDDCLPPSCVVLGSEFNFLCILGLVSEEEISWGKEWVITTVKKKAVELGIELTDVRWDRRGRSDENFNFELQLVWGERVQRIFIPIEELEDFEGTASKRRDFERWITEVLIKPLK